MIFLEEFKKHTIWQKARQLPGWNPSIWRLDDLNNVIRYTDYGNIQSAFGWEFDHIVPKFLGGSDDWSNLRPLYWKDNRSRNTQITPARVLIGKLAEAN